VRSCNPKRRLPTQSHESNGTECVGGCAERAFGLPPGSLRVTHRLDASTSGLVLLGRTRGAVTAFNASVARKAGAKEMTKTYVMLVSGAPRAPQSLTGTRRRGGDGDCSPAAYSCTKEKGGKTETETEIEGNTTEGTVQYQDEDSDSPAHGSPSGEVTRTAVAEPPVPLGVAVHWMYPGPFGTDALGGQGLRRSQARLLMSSAEPGDHERAGPGGTRRGVGTRDTRDDGAQTGFEAATDRSRSGSGNLDKKWRRCELVILSCEPASTRAVDTWSRVFTRGLDMAHKHPPSLAYRRLPESTTTGCGNLDSTADVRDVEDDVWEVRCELVTGRTHQVRAQLAAMGAPLLGEVINNAQPRWSFCWCRRCVRVTRAFLQRLCLHTSCVHQPKPLKPMHDPLSLS